MVTLSIYMAAVVDLKTLATFKRRNTIYFWSLLITSWGIILHSVSVILKDFVSSCPWAVYAALSSLGWWGMVTGQSLVLYSRLHLFIKDQRVLRALLAMILVDFCLFQVPTTLQKFLSAATNSTTWLSIYHVYERIQLVVFTVQELIISIIYIRAALKWFFPSDRENIQSTRTFLICLNVLCIAVDVAIICEVSTGQWAYEEPSQSLAYSIKLTLEFAVLNKVMDVYHRLSPNRCSQCHQGRTSPQILPSHHTEPKREHHRSPMAEERQAHSAKWLFTKSLVAMSSRSKSSERVPPDDRYDEG